MFEPQRIICSLLLFVICAAAACAAQAASVAQGAPAVDAARQADAGFYVWHDQQGNWRVRLLGGNRSHAFTASVWATKPFWSVGGVALESGDVLERPSPQAIKLRFSVAGADQDGIDFTLPGDAGICIDGWGTLGRAMRLGAGRAPAEGPVDLRGTGACGGFGQPASSPSAPSSPGGDAAGARGLKYNPGHYIAMTAWDGRATMIQAMQPGVRGIHKRYLWKDLEPRSGVYDFSGIAADLQIVADHGRQLVVIIEDKTFQGGKPLPAYLDRMNLRNQGGGFTAKRWDPLVITRMAALTRAMGARFDGHANFEGIAFQESAPSLSDQVLNANGYTAEKYRDALAQVLINARAHFPSSQVFWYMNFLPRNQGYIRQVANRVAAHGIVMGGPDVLPDDGALVTMSYPYYPEFKGRLKLFASMQYDSYAHRRKGAGTRYWTMPEMFRYARDRLHANYVFWTRQPKPQYQGSYDWTHALPVIRSNPSFNQ
jgi:hypothetical protein